MSEAAIAKKPDEETVIADDADFNAGFDAGTNDQLPPAANANASEITTETPTTETPPEYVQVTRADFERLTASAEKTERLEQQMSKAFGTIGNMQQLLEKVRSETPAGAPVEITDEDIAEMQEDFPELAAYTRKTLERVFGKLKLRGTGEAPALDQDAVTRVVREARLRDEMDALEEAHPGWRDVVGRSDDAENPFRRWLAQQPKDYQDRINTTQSATVTARAIDRFKAATAKKPATAAAPTDVRRERIQSAVQPRGSGSAPVAKPRTDEDAFDEGFQTG